jgi:transposase, IS605 orfB family
MQKRKFTVVSQLHSKNNEDLIEYLESSRKDYARAYRETYHTFKNSTKFDKSRYNTYLQNKYGITTRTANSIILDATGRYNAIKALKKYELQQAKYKLSYLVDKVIPNLECKRQKYVENLNKRELISLVQYRNLKLKLFSKKVKANKLRQRIENLEWQLSTGKFRICFGTKRLLKMNYNAFVEHRDSQLSYTGSKDETSGNQLLQLRFSPKLNQFLFQLRKDFGGYKNVRGSYVYGRVYFNHHKKKILNILSTGSSPLSYRFIKRNSRWYLYCTFEIVVEDHQFVTTDSYGTLGLDFNKGFITLSETNKYGHLVSTNFFPYRFKSGHATKTDLESIVNKVVSYASEIGKDVCIEGLDFKQTRSKVESKQGKKYNEMLHSLAYSTFMQLVENIAFRNLVYVKKVNPAWTSWIANKKYCRPMKLNIHIGASYVIARRGQGFVDTV